MVTFPFRIENAMHLGSDIVNLRTTYKTRYREPAVVSFFDIAHKEKMMLYKKPIKRVYQQPLQMRYEDSGRIVLVAWSNLKNGGKSSY